MAQTAQQKKRDQEILLALAAAFTAGGGGYILLLTVRNLLTEFGLGYDLASWLATMSSSPLPGTGSLGVPEGPCQVQEIEHAAAWRAMYLIAAADRLLEALDVPFGTTRAAQTVESAQRAEERYFELHMAAEERRMRAAALQDMAARLNGDREKAEAATLLNWRAVMDARTTFECAQANGMNFRADRMPVIGWPGAVHNRCRCSAGPAVPGAPLMASI